MANPSELTIKGKFRYIADWLADNNYLIIADENTERKICDVWLTLTDEQLEEARKLLVGADIECEVKDMEYPRYWKHCRSATLVELKVINNTGEKDTFNPNSDDFLRDF